MRKSFQARLSLEPHLQDLEPGKPQQIFGPTYIQSIPLYLCIPKYSIYYSGSTGYVVRFLYHCVSIK